MPVAIGDIKPAPVPPVYGPREQQGTDRDHQDVARLRELAREGVLAATYAAAPAEQRRWLSGAVIRVASPVVFNRLTRTLELNRGHAACAVAITRLADGCLDRFYDDLEAVTQDVLHHATTPITNLEGWMARRLRAATVDAHRRRRGEIGAQQRPRLPGWLDEGLGRDPWLGRLAIEILTWVGVTATAGSSLWPLDSWSDLRTTVTGVRCDDIRTVEREVETVLAVMRTRPAWYERYVERPLGAKVPPTAPGGRGETGDDLSPLMLVDQHEAVDAKLTELASMALAAIETQISRGADLAATVADVLARVFGPIDLEWEIGDLPHAAPTADEQVAALITDPAELARLVDVIQTILAGAVTRA